MRTRIFGAALLATAALVTSFFISSAPARPTPAPVNDAECIENGPFNTLQRLTKPAEWRVRDPHHLLEDQPSAPGSARRRGGADFRVVVPTYIHVITNGSLGAVSDETIKRQMIALDLSYRGFYGGVDTGFRFELRGVTRTNNATWFNMGAESSAESAAKRALRRGGPNALNIYTTAGGGYLGWAYYPDIVLSPADYHLDGVVVDFQSLPGGAYGTQYSLEAGHWLNLAHTFEGGCFGPGDNVADTPAQASPTSGCPVGRDSCPSDPGLDPIHNFMDYSYDSCYTEFSAGQATRMQDAWMHWRGMMRN
jgi:hypothetical protein